MSGPISSLGLTCPSGGQFYICQGNTTQFLGCCASDPCADGKGSCPQADIRYASFNASDYAKIHSQACASTDATDKWYTCSGAGLHDPFLGCCASNACGGGTGCPTKDLVAARLSDDKSSAAAFLTAAASSNSRTASATASSSGSKSTRVSSSTAGTISSATVSKATATATGAVGSRSGSSSGLSTGAKAGIGVGCAVALVAVVGVLLFFIRRRQGVVMRGSEPPTPSNMRENPTTPSHHYGMRPFSQCVTSPTVVATNALPDPNQILWSPHPPSGASDVPLAAARAAESPAASYARSYSPASSPSTDMVSRETSMRSESSHGLGIAPASPRLSDGAGRQQCATAPQSYASQGQQYLDPRQLHRPLATLAELDGTDVSRPTREPPRTSLAPLAYRPYKPPAERFQEERSELC